MARRSCPRVLMNWRSLVLVLCFVHVGFAAGPSPLQRLQARVRVEPVSRLMQANLAGKYSSPTKEFSPGLSGDNLYLFPDGTYIYDEWADIQPLTIYDKGEWKVDDGIIVLSSDKEISWDPGEEHRYIAFSRHSHPGEILLIGISTALDRFEEDRDIEPETAVMIFAKDRRSAIGKSKADARIKKNLIRTEWNPAYFEKK